MNQWHAANLMKQLFSFFVAFFSFILGSYGLAGAFEALIDPGHSPASPGAISCVGQKEFVYNNNLAAALAAKLRQAGINAALSRGPGENISLPARAARASGKDLLISVHHDSVQPQFLSKSHKFPTSEKARGFSLFVSRKNKFFPESLAYAKRIGEQLRRAGFKPTLHHAEPIKGENRRLLDRTNGIYEFNDLIVLKNADAPALLLEAGVLAHPDEEKQIRGRAYQNRLATAVAAALAGSRQTRP